MPREIQFAPKIDLTCRVAKETFPSSLHRTMSCLSTEELCLREVTNVSRPDDSRFRLWLLSLAELNLQLVPRSGHDFPFVQPDGSSVSFMPVLSQNPKAFGLNRVRAADYTGITLNHVFEVAVIGQQSYGGLDLIKKRDLEVIQPTHGIVFALNQLPSYRGHVIGGIQVFDKI